MIQFLIPPSSLAQPSFGATPNFATEKEPKRNFLYFADVTLVEVDKKSERFIKSTCLQQDLFDITMVTIKEIVKYQNGN